MIMAHMYPVCYISPDDEIFWQTEPTVFSWRHANVHLMHRTTPTAPHVRVGGVFGPGSDVGAWRCRSIFDPTGRIRTAVALCRLLHFFPGWEA